MTDLEKYKMLYTTLIVISVFYLVMTVYSGYVALDKLKEVEIGEAQRIHRYKYSIAWNGVSVIFVFVILCFTDISLNNIGFRNIVFNFNGPSKVITIFTLVVFSLLTVAFL